MSEVISMEEWMAELERLNNKPDRKRAGLTTMEIKSALGVGENKARAIIRGLLESGQMRLAKESRPDMAGRTASRTVYVPVFSGGGKIKKK